MTAGWMVIVGIIKADDSVGHITYAVALADPARAIDAALQACAGVAAVINRELGEEAAKDLGLKAGEVLAIYDDKNDPITSRTPLH